MATDDDREQDRPGQWGVAILAWAAVSLPLAWGVLMTLRKAAQLFAPNG